eukprot:gene5625-biopygen7467
MKMAYIQWRQQKVKVNLAAQSFSSSVASAIEYCRTVLKLKQFEGSEATVQFIRNIDRLFDILNSRNPWAKGFNSALRVNNKGFWGFNNNPTAQQFTAAYKRLLMRSSIGGGKGNCQQRDPTAILQTFGDTCNVDEEDISICNASLIWKYDLQDRAPLQSDHDYGDMPNIVSLSEYKVAAISCIAGYFGKMVLT